MAFTHIPGHQHVTEYGIVRHDGEFRSGRRHRLVGTGQDTPCFFRKFRPFGIPEITVQPPESDQPVIPGMRHGQRPRQKEIVTVISQCGIPEPHFIPGTPEFRFQHHAVPGFFRGGEERSAGKRTRRSPVHIQAGVFRIQGNGHMMPGPGGKRVSGCFQNRFPFLSREG